MTTKRPTVEIFCADRSHEPRRVIVAVFERRSPAHDPVPSKKIDWPGVLSMIAGGKPQPWEEMSVTSRGVLNMDKHTGQDLDATDTPMPGWQEEQPAVERWRYSLACKLCGLTVPARGERLYPVLDKLADVGVPEVSLSGLAATLRRQ